MNKVYSEFRRGDVWFVKLNTEFGDNQDNSSVQRKSRPYLIVSCEANNNCAPTINAVPITTRPSDHLPMHIYYDYNGRHQLILCEQITTLSVIDFHRSGSHYMYNLSVDFMNTIDDALSAQLGLRPRVADMKVLENLIDKISADKEAELKRKYEDAIQSKVSEIAAKLAKKFNVDLTSQDMLDGVTYRPSEMAYASSEDKKTISDTAKERMTPSSSVSEPKEHITVKTNTTTDRSKKSDKKHSRRQWTEAAMKEFLAASSHLSVSVMSAKYGIAKKSVTQYVCLFKKKLETKD